jgi:hypothetical protein
MTITAKIIADSVSPGGVRITTMQLRYPRFIHAEFMTHRMFSRNASSSRAIPVERLIEDVLLDPAMPVYWGKNQKGMQAREELSADEQLVAQALWLDARDRAVDIAVLMMRQGVHKQIVNRVLEPFSHINVLVTATDWANFYALRRHEDAQPEMKALADAMWEAQQASEPAEIGWTEWHLPFIHQVWVVKPNEFSPTARAHDGYRVITGPEAWERVELTDAIKCSVALCARVSYQTHDGGYASVESNLALYDQLVGSEPLHASPAEHQAFSIESTARAGNFRGWMSYRKMLPGECVKD